MDFEEFKEQFTEDVKQGLADAGIDAKVSINTVEKMNESYEAMTVTPEGSNVGVNVNMEKFFEAYENGTPYEDVVDKAVNVVEGGFANQPTVDVAALTDYDQMKDKLVMEVVSAEANADMLDKVPHQQMEDMAVVYRFELDSNDDGRATILVTNQLIETMGVTPEQLHADAMENAPELKPAVIKGMSEVMAEMMGVSTEDLAMMGMPMDPADEQMFVASVPDKIHGAGVLAYQDFMDQAAERAGGDFFILPSSIHEVLIVPDNGNMSLSDLEAMVKEVNATQVAPEDKLTDSVYHYDSQAKVFELGEKFVERQSEKEAGIEADTKKTVIEVEAGQATINYKFLKDFYEACLMDDIDYLCIAVCNEYKYGTNQHSFDFKKVTEFFDAMYMSNRVSIPLKGILIVGY